MVLKHTAGGEEIWIVKWLQGAIFAAHSSSSSSLALSINFDAQCR